MVVCVCVSLCVCVCWALRGQGAERPSHVVGCGIHTLIYILSSLNQIDQIDHHLKQNRPAGMREGHQTVRACSTMVKLPMGCEVRVAQ